MTYYCFLCNDEHDDSSTEEHFIPRCIDGPEHQWLPVCRDGSLILRLAEGVELEVRKQDCYEAWHTFGGGNFADANMLCSPGEGPPWGD